MMEETAGKALRAMDRIGKGAGFHPLPSHTLRTMLKEGAEVNDALRYMLDLFCGELRATVKAMGYRELLPILDGAQAALNRGDRVQSARALWAAAKGHRQRRKPDEEKVFIHVRVSADEKAEMVRRAKRYFGSQRSVTKYILSVMNGEIPMRAKESYAETRDENLIMKFNLEDKRMVEAKAEREGYNFSEFIRNMALGDEKNSFENSALPV